MNSKRKNYLNEDDINVVRRYEAQVNVSIENVVVHKRKYKSATTLKEKKVLEKMWMYTTKEDRKQHKILFNTF